MSAIRYLAWRTAAAVILVFAVASGAMLLSQLAPGDYASGPGTNRAQREAERHRLGLDRPLAEQYLDWAHRVLTLDLGDSLHFQQPVATLVRRCAANTALLASTALLVATFLGIPAGVITGSRRGAVARLIAAASLLLLSMPPLITALVLLTLAAATGWLPVSGMGGVSHLVVPALALALPVAATLERLQSQAIAEVLARPAALAARARGVPAARVVWRHAWRASLGPVLAVYGVTIGALFSGSFAVEIVTSWPGLGDLMRQAMVARDSNLVAGCAAAGAACLAIGILAADVAHVLIDPRLALGARDHA